MRKNITIGNGCKTHYPLTHQLRGVDMFNLRPQCMPPPASRIGIPFDDRQECRQSSRLVSAGGFLCCSWAFRPTGGVN